VNIEEEEPEEAEPPCPSTSKSHIGRRIRNLFRSSSNQLPLDQNVNIDNNDDIDEDLVVHLDKRMCKKQRYEIKLDIYTKNLALFQKKMVIYKKKVAEFELFSYTFRDTLVLYKNKIAQFQSKINKYEQLVVKTRDKLDTVIEARALRLDSRARAKRQRAVIRQREANTPAPMRLRAHVFLSNSESSTVVKFLLRVLSLIWHSSNE